MFIQRKSSLTLNDINKIVDDIVRKEKEKGIISLSNLIEKISKKYMKLQKLIENSNNETEEEEKVQIEKEVEIIKEEIYNKLSLCVEREYQNGFQDLLQPQNENQVYFVLEFNGPNGFYKKFYPDNEVKIDIEEGTTKQNEILTVEEIKDDSIISSNNKIKLQDLKVELIERKLQTIEYIKLINFIYSGFDIYEKVLLKKIISQYAEKKAQEFSNNEPNKYKILTSKKDLLTLPIENDKSHKFITKLFSKYIFFEFKFEDFLLLYLRLTKFFYGIEAIIEIDETNSVFVKLYGTELNFQILADSYKFHLQIKPYANYYDQLSKRVQYICENENDLLLLSENRNILNQQFAEMDQNNHLNFPPYLCYLKEKNLKFRRYTNDDNYHNCPRDPEFTVSKHTQSFNSPSKKPFWMSNIEEIAYLPNCCSVFRNIDKIRLIICTFEDKILLNLKKYGSLESIYILRNFKESKLNNNNLLWDAANIFNAETQKEFVHNVRNFFGEKYSFLLLFHWYFLLWLLFPIFLGLLLWNMHMFHDNFYLDNMVFKDIDLKIGDSLYFFYCFIIVNWGISFVKYWKNKEKLYSYFWGVETILSREDYRSEFVADGEEEFMFDQKRPYQSNLKKIFKLIIAYLITFFIIAIGFLIIFQLLRWEKKKIRKMKILNNEISTTPIFLTSLILAFQKEVFDHIYKFIAQNMTLWENHEKMSSFENSLILKIVIFKSLNSFSAIFYISFLKEKYEGCVNKNCFFEIGTQIYLNLAAFFVVRLTIYLKRLFVYILNKRKISNDLSSKEISFEPQTLYRLKAQEGFEYTLVSMNDIVVFFGYILFFSVAAPLTPVFVFLNIYFFVNICLIQRLIENYTIYYFFNSNNVQEIKGIEIYNKILKFFCLIGSLSCISLVLFSNPSFKNVSIVSKISTIAIFENIMLLILYFVNFSFLPKWYYETELIKSIYASKYFQKQNDALPHHDLNSKLSHRIMISSIINLNEESQSQQYKINLSKDENKKVIDDKEISNVNVIHNQ